MKVEFNKVCGERCHKMAVIWIEIGDGNILSFCEDHAMSAIEDIIRFITNEGR